jgi:uncharacterized protein (DUF433 family)
MRIMPLEDYFDFLAPNDIRVRGHRIGIETILDEYLYYGRTPEEIQRLYPTLRLAEVYATILYYLENQDTVSRYLADWEEACRRSEEAFDRDPPPIVARLRETLRELEPYSHEERIRILQERISERRAREEASPSPETAEVA